jgi:hypothetical protein
MAVIVNKNTTQTPIATGLTGAQVVKFIDAPRVYVKAVDSTPTPIVVKSNGSTPSGYTDLGVVEGKVRVAYDKEIAEVRTGIDQFLRQSYVRQKTGTFEFVLSQFDDVVMKEISGLTPSVITSGSIVQFNVGSEDVISRALLMVVQNKLDGKEQQFYNPAADLSFTIEDSGDATVIRGRADLKGFTFGGVEQLYVLSTFAA